MKITTTKTIETEIEITFPYYTQTGNDYNAIISENEMIVVLYREFISMKPSVWVVCRSLDNSALIGEPITKEEFNEKYHQALTYITKTVPQ